MTLTCRGCGLVKVRSDAATPAQGTVLGERNELLKP